MTRQHKPKIRYFLLVEAKKITTATEFKTNNKPCNLSGTKYALKLINLNYPPITRQISYLCLS
jgi:hypothetical protein